MSINQKNEPIGLDALFAIDRLPILRKSRSYMVSSYNRDLWNRDDTPAYLEKNKKEGTIAEIEGPGCIYRIWSGGDPGARFKFYFDGQKEAGVCLRFSGQSGEPEPQKAGILPLTSGIELEVGYPPMMETGVKNGPHLETGICYMPIPFEKSCKITIEPAVERKYFQINYHLLPKGTPLKTFDLAAISQEEIQRIKSGVDMWNRSGEVLALSSDKFYGTVRMKDGEESVLLDLQSTGGRINAIRIKLPESMRTEQILRSLILKAYWDGEDRASIDAALGPFFCDAFGTPSEDNPIPLSEDMNENIPDEEERKKYTFGLPLEYKNFLLGYTRDRGYYVYFPMPFFSGAKITLTNETGQEIDGINYEIEYDTKNKPNSDLGRFHAFYHRENPTIGIEDPEALKVDFTGKDNYVILKTSGWGHFVGVSFFMVQKRRLPQNVESNSVGAICEGNEMIYIDNNPEQTQIGTGTEDYLNQNFWVHDHIYPFDGNRQGYRSCYRMHISDCIPFSEKIAVTIEHGAGNAHFIDYSSVAYWYQKAKPWINSGGFKI